MPLLGDGADASIVPPFSFGRGTSSELTPTRRADRSIAEVGARDDGRVAAGPGGEAVPGGLRLAALGQQPGRVAELAAAIYVGPGEPPDAADPPGAAMPGQHSEGLVELPRLPEQAPLPARLEAVGAPAELGHVEERGGIVMAAHDPAQVADLRSHRRGVGDVGVQGDAVEEALDAPGPVDAVEEVAGADVGGDLQRPAEEAAEDHLGAAVGAVDGATADPQQPREALRVRPGGEADDVRLVPDLPLADRQRREPGVLAPEGAPRAVAAHRAAQERGPGLTCPAAIDGFDPRLAGDPGRRAPDEGEDPHPVFGGELHRAVEVGP